MKLLTRRGFEPKINMFENEDFENKKKSIMIWYDIYESICPAKFLNIFTTGQKKKKSISSEY